MRALPRLAHFLAQLPPPDKLDFIINDMDGLADKIVEAALATDLAHTSIVRTCTQLLEGSILPPPMMLLPPQSAMPVIPYNGPPSPSRYDGPMGPPGPMGYGPPPGPYHDLYGPPGYDYDYDYDRFAPPPDYEFPDPYGPRDPRDFPPDFGPPRDRPPYMGKRRFPGGHACMRVACVAVMPPAMLLRVMQLLAEPAHSAVRCSCPMLMLMLSV